MVNVGDYEVKEGLYYSKDHFWVKIEGGKARCGITDYAQKMLKHVVYADLPPIDSEITQDEVCGSLESTKAVSDLISPLSGKVLEINSDLEEDAGHINHDPYGKGWMFLIEPSKLESELTNLKTHEEAIKWHEDLLKK
jgi:glycine cleavage system H protein